MRRVGLENVYEEIFCIPCPKEDSKMSTWVGFSAQGLCDANIADAFRLVRNLSEMCNRESSAHIGTHSQYVFDVLAVL